VDASGVGLFSFRSSGDLLDPALGLQIAPPRPGQSPRVHPHDPPLARRSPARGFLSKTGAGGGDADPRVTVIWDARRPATQPHRLMVSSESLMRHGTRWAGGAATTHAVLLQKQKQAQAQTQTQHYAVPTPQHRQDVLADTPEPAGETTPYAQVVLEDSAERSRPSTVALALGLVSPHTSPKATAEAAAVATYVCLCAVCVASRREY